MKIGSLRQSGEIRVKVQASRGLELPPKVRDKSEKKE